MNKISSIIIISCFALLAKAQRKNVSPYQNINHNYLTPKDAVLNNHLSEADVFFENAGTLEKQNNLNEALALYGKAAFAYNNDNKTSQYAFSLFKISNIHLQLANYNEAEQVVLNPLLKAYDKLKNKQGFLLCYTQLAKIYLGLNKLTQSMWFYTQQGILSKQLGNNSAYIESFIGLAYAKIKKKDYNLALKDLQYAESLSKNYQITQFNQQIETGKDLISKLKTNI